MSMSSFFIPASDLSARIGTAQAPMLFDTCRDKAFASAERVVAGAKWRDPGAIDRWVTEIPQGRDVVVNCVHGHQMSQSTVARLRQLGVNARVLQGGIEGYIEAGGVTIRKSETLPKFHAQATRWVTREKPKVGRIACPWFIRRFVDPAAEIFFVEADWVKGVAVELDAIPFDVPETEFSHEGEKCSFDVFLDRFGVEDGSLRHLARIVRAADTGRPDLEPEAAGLLALSLGVSAANHDDHAALAQGMVIYDGLYSWCRNAVAETHNWPAQGTSQ